MCVCDRLPLPRVQLASTTASLVCSCTSSNARRCQPECYSAAAPWGMPSRASAGGCVLCYQPRIVSTRVVHGQGASTTSLGVPINRAAEEGGVRASCSPDADKEAVGLDALPDVGAPLHRLQWRVRAHLVVWPGGPELHRLRLHTQRLLE